MTLNSQIWQKLSLLWEAGWTRRSPEVPSNWIVICFHDSMTYFSVLFDLQNMRISGTIDPCDTFTNQLYFHVYHSVFKIVTILSMSLYIYLRYNPFSIKRCSLRLTEAFCGSTMPTKRQTPLNLSVGLDWISTTFREKPGSRWFIETSKKNT